jgi:hypothetical protein
VGGLTAVVAGSGSGLAAATRAEPSEPVGRAVDALDDEGDEGDEQAGDLVCDAVLPPEWNVDRPGRQALGMPARSLGLRPRPPGRSPRNARLSDRYGEVVPATAIRARG